jgi:hypothetical protein
MKLSFRTALKTFIGVLFLAGVVWVGWKFQPWMPAGQAVYLTSAHLDDCDFQVWQRKNAGLSEPFATGLFVRRAGSPWEVFLLDIQDIYRPTISLRKESRGIVVLSDGDELGVLDSSQGIYKKPNGVSRTGDPINSDPPGNWWTEAAGKW